LSRTPEGNTAAQKREGVRLAKTRVEMTKILICAFILCLPCSVCFGQTASTVPVDLVVGMDTSTVGTTLSSAILNAGTTSKTCTVGSTCNWTSTTANFTVAANQSSCGNLGPVALNNGGPTYTTGQLAYNSIAFDDVNNEASEMSMPSGINAISGLVCHTAPPFVDDGSDTDMFGLWSGAPNGNFAMTQVNPTACGGSASLSQYGVRIEVKPTSHSPCINLVPGNMYWFSINYNFATGVATLYVYNAPSGTQVKCSTANSPEQGTCNSNGSVTITAGDTGGPLDHVTFGNGESQDSAGTTTYFQNIMYNWTTAPNPMFWSGNTTVQPPSNLIATVQSAQ
jgi:hypothetical protein